MTSPTPSPTPSAPDSAAVTGSDTPDSNAPDSSAPASSVAAAPTTPPPCPLTPDAQTALQSALAAEQAAVWAYGLVAAYARVQATMTTEARSGHLLRRDATTARIIQGGATAPEPAAAYQ